MASVDQLSEQRPPPPRRRLPGTPGVPWYRDRIILRIITQIVFAVAFIGFFVYGFNNLADNLSESSIGLDFGVYTRAFNVDLEVRLPADTTWDWVPDTGTLNDYLKPNTVTRALLSGFVNTVLVVIVSIVACTVLGILAGIGLLSSNFLLRTVSATFVEIFRNTPLLVQLFFIYDLLLTLLKRPVDPGAIESPDSFLGFDLHEKIYFVNTRGFYFPALQETDTTTIFYIAIALAFVVIWGIRRWRLNLQETTGTPSNTWRIALPTAAGILLVGWWLAGGFLLSAGPFSVDYPALQGSNVQGGLQFNITFVALVLGLTFYTAAFIADIVRAGIQAVPTGQIEAARAHGLSNSQVLNLVVLPQALRLIVPPLGNQYVNLGKNSSLGIAVGYYDTYRIMQLANNESGQAVPIFVGLMITYLILSLVLSLFTNMLNNTTRLRTR